MRYKYFYIGTKSSFPNRPQQKHNPKQITQCEVRVNVCTTGQRSQMACLDRNTDVTAVSTQVPVIRFTHGVESCFFHDSITVLITIVCFQPNHYLRKLISKVNPSFKGTRKRKLIVSCVHQASFCLRIVKEEKKTSSHPMNFQRFIC